MESLDSDHKSNIIQAFRSLSPVQRRVLPRLLSRKERLLFVFFSVFFLASSIYAISALVNRYSVLVPTQGGSLREGIIGIPRFINPLLASSDADRDLSNMVYTGLLRNNGKGALVPSLADRYDISENGLIYTFYLKDNVRWSDGIPLTADDIVFTLSLVKDPNYRSVLRANWEGVTVEKSDEKTIIFKLAKPYAPFLENATLGILPKHIWHDVLATEFSLSEKNLRPVGAGPYRVISFEQNAGGRILSYILEQNPYYVPHPPYIKQMEFVFFTSATEVEDAYRNGLIDTASIPLASEISPSKIAPLRLPLPRIFGVFFNQNSSVVLADNTVRKALTQAIDRQRLVENVLHNQGVAISTPLPPNVLGSLDPAELLTLPTFDANSSMTLLTDAGWIDSDNDGVREKKIDKELVRLSFTISTSDAPDLVETGKSLQEMWRAAGAEVDLNIFEIGDFEQDVLRPRKYEAILFGEIFGFDPDPFAFWHSSQRNDPGLNIALYTNPRADTLLEQARSQVGREEREQTYREFQRIIIQDYPAVFLYSLDYVYQPSINTQGYSITSIVIPSDRFGSVHEWFIKTKKQWEGFKE